MRRKTDREHENERGKIEVKKPQRGEGEKSLGGERGGKEVDENERKREKNGL